MTDRQALTLMRRLASWRPPQGIEHVIRWDPAHGRVDVTLRSTDCELRTYTVEATNAQAIRACLDHLARRMLADGGAKPEPSPRAVATATSSPPTTPAPTPADDTIEPPAPWLANTLEEIIDVAVRSVLVPGVTLYARSLVRSIESDRIDQPRLACPPGGGLMLQWKRADGRGLSVVVTGPFAITITRYSRSAACTSGWRDRDCLPMLLVGLEWLYPDLFAGGGA